jgi:glycosyltransferase involved in cell wall biosynthesis
MTRPVPGRVSVIIPAFNRRATILRAMNSALAQTHPDVEVLVVDDASTDGTADLVASIQHRRLKLLRHATNRGGAAARNTAAAAATGEFLAFLDSDDEWDATKIERQLAALRERHTQLPDDWAGAYCGYQFVLDDSVTTFKPTLEGRFAGELLRMTAPVSAGSTMMLRHDVFDALGGFDLRFKRHQDFELLLRFFRRHRLALVPDALATIHGTHPPAAAVIVETKLLFLEAFRADIDALGPRRARQVRAIHWCQAAAHGAAERRIGMMLSCLGRMVRTGSVAWRQLPSVGVAFVRGVPP